MGRRREVRSALPRHRYNLPTDLRPGYDRPTYRPPLIPPPAVGRRPRSVGSLPRIASTDRKGVNAAVEGQGTFQRRRPTVIESGQSLWLLEAASRRSEAQISSE